MPKKITNQMDARKTGTNSRTGNRAQRIGCAASRGTEAGAPSIVADSLSALRLKTVPGAKLAAQVTELGGLVIILNMVRKCVRKLFPGEKLRAPKGLCDYEELAWWQQKLKEAMPTGVDYLIDGDDRGFWIDFFMPTRWSWDRMYQLHCLHILHHLECTDRFAHELFIRFLNKFVHVIRCDTWEIGVFPEGLLWLEEDMLMDSPETEEASLPQLKREIEFFNKGYGHMLGMRIHKQGPPTLEYLRDQSKRVRDPFIRELIRAGCDVMEPGYAMSEFVDVTGLIDNGWTEGIRFDSQVCLFLGIESNTIAYSEYEARLEAMYNEGGLAQPVVWQRMRPNDNNSKIDFEELRRREGWLEKLWEFLEIYNSVSTLYYEERIEKFIEGGL